MNHPNYVIVKLDDPVGPDDAQNLAEHIITELAFADVESATPARFEGGSGRLVLTGPTMSATPIQRGRS
jgi:hypothetical protein